MNGLAATLRLDIRLQARSKLYAIGIAVAIVFGLAGRFLFPLDLAGRVLAAFYLLGLGSTTYMFAAALLLSERSEGSLHALRTSPLTSTAYLASKVITLTTFAVVESAIVYAVAFFGAALNPLPLVCGVVCLGVLYALVGLAQVASLDSVTAFLFPGALLTGLVLQLPVFNVLQVGPPLLWYLIPTQGPLLLMLAATEPLESWQWAYASGVSSLSIGLAWWWAKRRFARHVGLQER